MQTKLIPLLLSHAPLVTLVANRVQWDVLPQGAPLGQISLSVVSGVVDYHTTGASGLVEARIQFDCRDATAAKARAIADEVNAKLSGFRGVFGGYQFKGCFEIGQRTSHGKVDAYEWFTDSRDYTIIWGRAS